jgi:hypothetical protein
MADIPIIRWILTDKISAKWIASVYAERYERVDPNDPTHTYHFWWGDKIVASVDQTSGVNVGDSGGRLVMGG